MSLAGNLSTMPLSDLFAWVESRGKSGVIRVVQADVERKFWVHGRHITGVGSSVEDEHLGRLLVDHGLVDKDAIAQALALQAETQVRLGKILLMLEVIDEQTLAQALTVKIVDAVADALSWPTGSFDFEPGAVATRSFEVEVKIELGECVERAKERALRWRRTRAVIPTVDTRFWLADDHALAKLSGQERELAEAGRDGASAREIAQSLRRSRLPVVEELAELVRAGVLTIDRRPGERAVGDGAPALEELVA
ncbi:MAG: DUF4388 domain-containing protein, partial [Deltaproteobacteria bacterium]|nr:DUF4388 domain-containing protein [Deltaproteobacteria bacterium]